MYSYNMESYSMEEQINVKLTWRNMEKQMNVQLCKAIAWRWNENK